MTEQRQLDAVVRLVRRVLGDAAVGVYLFGSAVTAGLRGNSDLRSIKTMSRSRVALGSP